jgi:hypothetical protein
MDYLVRKSTDQSLLWSGKKESNLHSLSATGLQPAILSTWLVFPDVGEPTGCTSVARAHLRGLEPPRLSKVLHFSSTWAPLNSRHILNIKHDR